MSEKYFLTVDWCNEGKRGIFCSRSGDTYWKEDSPHTADEMWDVLGCFDLVLSPQSVPLTESELKEYRRWTPLEEYSGAYGVARKS